MRLAKFESSELKPLGEGDEKKSFVDPKNEGRIISERKEGAEKDTLRRLKGRYYLTKIAHLLLPANIPDIYQAGESDNGEQTVNTERISHSPGQVLLQELRRSGENEEPAREKILEELGPEMSKLDATLEQIGFGFSIDPNVGNYTKNEGGNAYYLETFKPWQIDAVNPKKLEVLFDEGELRNAIEAISDQETRERCTQYLERLLVLLEEEKKDTQGLQENRESSLLNCGPGIEKIELAFAPYLEKDVLASLHAIKTQEEALSNSERALAVTARNLIYSQLKYLQEKTNITAAEYERLHEQYMTLKRAVGAINGGLVDHTR